MNVAGGGGGVYQEKISIGTFANKEDNRASLCHFRSLMAVLRIRDVYPGSRILIFTHPGSRIPDPKTGRKERGGKKFFVKHFFVATNFTKCKII
jgi:hypothetical protein